MNFTLPGAVFQLRHTPKLPFSILLATRRLWLEVSVWRSKVSSITERGIRWHKAEIVILGDSYSMGITVSPILEAGKKCLDRLRGLW